LLLCFSEGEERTETDQELAAVRREFQDSGPTQETRIRKTHSHPGPGKLAVLKFKRRVSDPHPYRADPDPGFES